MGAANSLIISSGFLKTTLSIKKVSVHGQPNTSGHVTMSSDISHLRALRKIQQRILDENIHICVTIQYLLTGYRYA